MPGSIDQILPSLEALGLWSYWIIGLASLLEAFFFTGVFMPGTLVVDAGGILVQQGAIDFFDLVWFVALGSFLGGEIGYWVGVWARRGLNTRWKPENSAGYQKAERLFQRHGGLALVIGRFLGPVSGLVPFAASVAGMKRRRFVVWNLISGFPYALVHVSFGFFLGDVLTRLGPIATRLALFAAAALVVLAVLWWLIVRIERMLPFGLSVLRSIARGVAENPDVQAWAARHPGVAGFIAHRFDTGRFSGLTATLLGIAFIYVLTIWAGTVLDFLMADPIVQADTRLANLIHAFWVPWLLTLFTYVTALGDWRVVTSLALAALGGLALRRRADLMLGLGVALAGNVITVGILKKIFDRPRPELAWFNETSGSFPSGHAAISVAFYGMLFFTAWRLRWLGPIKAALLGATLAFVIGLSRLYLIEHYLSDVLNGWLVGALWMLVGIAAAEWWQEARQGVEQGAASGAGGMPLAALARPAAQRGLAAACLLLCGFATWEIASYDKARHVPTAAPGDSMVTDIAALFAAGVAPAETESVFGAALEPINVIVLARDETALKAAMDSAGWGLAEKPTLATLARAGWALLSGTQDTNAPVTPYFWRALPNDIAFQKPTADKTLRKRHHVRFWESHFVTGDGLRLFVGAASFDDGMDWQLLHHIDPNIDAERDGLAQDLDAASAVAQSQLPQITGARLGQSVAGDPWFTDGKAAVLTLK